MKLFNSLTGQVDTLKPLDGTAVRIYSCGPTVYDNLHIGNLASFIYADVLRRTVAQHYSVKHVMNITDIEDKIITRSQKTYPDKSPENALTQLTDTCTNVFLKDMQKIGNDMDSVELIGAVESIPHMQVLIEKLYKEGVAYIADDGVYFSIQAYTKRGKTYGQLSKIDLSKAQSRILNDEYSNEEAADFALWKKHKPGEPSWSFTLGNKQVDGRPGWHIECSAMSQKRLGIPFDIHTGGVDLRFPHHENEIAQSTALTSTDTYAKLFFHNEHLLVDGAKMSKSKHNFYTLRDVEEKNFSPMAFRMMVLQSHYRSQLNFSWENLLAAQNRLHNILAAFDQTFSPNKSSKLVDEKLAAHLNAIHKALANDLDTPEAITCLNAAASDIVRYGVHQESIETVYSFLTSLDEVFGLRLANDLHDVTSKQNVLLNKRQKAREAGDYASSDVIRDDLKMQGILVKDGEFGQSWTRDRSAN